MTDSCIELCNKREKEIDEEKMFVGIKDERAQLILKILTVLGIMPIKKRGYEQERWRAYWIEYFEKILKELGK